jgi:hypothetical protein
MVIVHSHVTQLATVLVVAQHMRNHTRPTLQAHMAHTILKMLEKKLSVLAIKKIRQKQCLVLKTQRVSKMKVLT